MVAAPAALAAGYTTTPLGGAAGSDAYALSPSGEVAGCDIFPTDPQNLHATTWRGALETDLQTGALAPLRPLLSCARGINSRGDVVGYFVDLNFDTVSFAVLNGAPVELPGGVAFGINDADQVVGQLSSDQHAYIWGNGVVTDLGTFGGPSSEAVATYASGEAVGDAQLPNGRGRAFVYRNGHMRNLGLLPGNGRLGSSGAADVNSSGQVVGSSTVGKDALTQRAFLWSAGTGMVDLGTLGGAGSRAMAISNAGVVTGVAQIARGAWHLFLWTPTRGMVDLTRNAGLTALQKGQVPNATGINFRGQVSALWGDPTIHNFPRGYLISPNG